MCDTHHNYKAREVGGLQRGQARQVEVGLMWGQSPRNARDLHTRLWPSFFIVGARLANDMLSKSMVLSCGLPESCGIVGGKTLNLNMLKAMAHCFPNFLGCYSFSLHRRLINLILSVLGSLSWLSGWPTE